MKYILSSLLFFYGLAFNTTSIPELKGIASEDKASTTISNVEANADVITILPFGDSLTNDGRGRVEFWNQMVSSGYTIDFVGDQHQGNSTGDPDHAGVGGRKIDQGASVIDNLLSTYDPDYVLMLLGTNDFAWYFAQPGDISEAEVAQLIADDHQALVEQILNNSPSGTTVIVSTIPKMTMKNVGQAGGERDLVRKELNILIRNYIAEMQAENKSVALSDVDQNIVLFEDVDDSANDGVHLTSSGYVKLGQAYHQSLISELESAVSNEPNTKPKEIDLKQNYPNPFNPTTSIQYSVPETGEVDLTIYNMIGKRVETLVSEIKSAGEYSVTWNATNMASGIYYYRFNYAGQVMTRQMTLIK